jgi:hypothetical protein
MADIDEHISLPYLGIFTEVKSLIIPAPEEILFGVATGLYYKTIYCRNLIPFVISRQVSLSLSLPSLSNICNKGRYLPEWSP